MRSFLINRGPKTAPDAASAEARKPLWQVGSDAPKGQQEVVVGFNLTGEVSAASQPLRNESHR